MKSGLLVAGIAALAFAGPASAKPGHGHENGHLYVGHGHRYGLLNGHHGHGYVYGRQGPVGYGIGGCPPGLAKKENGCMPPGQARKLLRGPHGFGMR